MRLYFSLKSAQRLRPVHGEKRRTIPYRAIVLSVRERNLFYIDFVHNPNHDAQKVDIMCIMGDLC